MSTVPQLFYWHIRGRGESIRLALAAAESDWEEVKPENFKSDFDTFPFLQAPSFKDGDAVLSQSKAILRHLGRKHNLYGSSLVENARVDAVLDGLEDLRKKYLEMVYTAALSDAGKETFWNANVDPATITETNRGAHWGFLSKMLTKNSTDKGFIVGSSLTIADLDLFELFDINLRVFGDKLKEVYPELAEHHARISAIPAIATYRNSKRLPEKVNGNGLG